VSHRRFNQDADHLEPEDCVRGLRPLVLLLAMAASGCDVLDIHDSAREQYEQGLERWEATRPEAYVVTLERICFCSPEAKGPVQVTVQGNTVLSRVYEASGEPVPAEFASGFPTIDGLFKIIKDALDDGYHDLEAFYDPATGIPFNFWIDYKQNVQDEEIGYNVDVPLGTPNGM
jgi:hypothetical protein